MSLLRAQFRMTMKDLWKCLVSKDVIGHLSVG